MIWRMLAFLAGELSNSAHFFSLLVMLHKKIASNLKKLMVRVATGNHFLSKKDLKMGSKETWWNILTSLFISKDLKGRQEFHPFVDKYIDCAKVEPLHLKNNTIKERPMSYLLNCYRLYIIICSVIFWKKRSKEEEGKLQASTLINSTS